MKILFIAPLLPPITGQSIACDLLLNNLKPSNEVETINLSKQTFLQGVNSFWRVVEVIGIIWKSARGNKDADIIYFTISESIAGNLKDLLIFATCWRRLDKMVVHLHGGAGMREIMFRKYSWLSSINKFFLRRLGAVIVLGSRLEYLYDKVVDKSRLHSVVNFANDEYFSSCAGIDKKFTNIKTLRLLFLSNLLPGKGHNELLSALDMLSSVECSRLQVDFAGGFETQEDELIFRKKVQRMKKINISVHGVVHGEQKLLLLHNAHLFCLPTYYPYEGQPISILEAYASGCAVMTTDHSGIFDTFTPGVNGIEVQPRSPESIAQAIQSALAQPQALKAYARTNLEHARQKYRASTHVAALEKIIYSVANSSTIK